MPAASASSTRASRCPLDPDEPRARRRRGARRSGSRTRSSPASPATTSTTAARPAFVATIEAIRRRTPGDDVEVLIPDCKGDAGGARRDLRGASRRAEPQPRDRGPAAARGAPVGGVRAVARAARARKGGRARDEVGHHPGHGRDGSTRCTARWSTCAASASTSSRSASTCARRRRTSRSCAGGRPRSSTSSATFARGARLRPRRERPARALELPRPRRARRRRPTPPGRDRGARCPEWDASWSGSRRSSPSSSRRSRCSSSRPRPTSTDDHVNVSPKGSTRSGCSTTHTVAYLDLTGSGIETVAHVRENGRITLMFCAFDGPPEHRPAAGHGHGDPGGRAGGARRYLERLPSPPGARAVIVVDVTRISTSCGYGVPLMELRRRARRSSRDWAAKQGRRRPRRVPREEERRRASAGCPDGADASSSRRARRAARARMDGARRRRAAALGRRRPARTSPATRRCRSSGSRCSCSRATATRSSWCPSSRRRGSTPQPGVFELRPWSETEDPIAIVAGLVGPARASVAIGDQTWARFVLRLQDALPARGCAPASRGHRARCGS